MKSLGDLLSIQTEFTEFRGTGVCGTGWVCIGGAAGGSVGGCVGSCDGCAWDGAFAGAGGTVGGWLGGAFVAEALSCCSERLALESLCSLSSFSFSLSFSFSFFFAASSWARFWFSLLVSSSRRRSSARSSSRRRAAMACAWAGAGGACVGGWGTLAWCGD